MKLILVRHGQSEGNTAKVHQHPDSPLSEHGRLQAHHAGKHLQNMKIDKMYSSTLPRAAETAAIIATHINNTIEHTPLLREIQRPSEVVGKPHEDLPTKNIWSIITEHYHDPSWHFSDEENFFDMKARVLSFLHHLQNHHTNENILVVTHGIFLRYLYAIFAHGQELSSKTYFHTSNDIDTDNTGISIIEYKNGAWNILNWNSTDHLPQENT